MKNTNFSCCVKLWVAALVLVCGVAFTGCKPDVAPEILPDGVEKLSNDSALIGTWVASEYEQYIIKPTTFNGGSYTGNSLVVMKNTESSGMIFVKYEKAYDWNNPVYVNPNDSTYYYSSYEYDGVTYESWYPLDSTKIGKWYAISYTDLTANSIKISGALGSKTDHKIEATATLEKAIEEFTIENGYFSQYSTCAKQ